MNIKKSLINNLENEELKTFLLQKPSNPTGYPILKIKGKVDQLLITHERRVNYNEAKNVILDNISNEDIDYSIYNLQKFVIYLDKHKDIGVKGEKNIEAFKSNLERIVEDFLLLINNFGNNLDKNQLDSIIYPFEILNNQFISLTMYNLESFSKIHFDINTIIEKYKKLKRDIYIR